ncbi:MAG TPA: UDP-N-acetylmuramate--L-alanine ligase [Euzebya sp.]|nr:UDP-N-acetylmuramate--L-alanine ligase [Euzebya sp.]
MSDGLADPDDLALTSGTRIHLVGIGGSGMSPLAQIMLQRGMDVRGSDLRGGATCDVLATMGATIQIGHAADNVGTADVVVISNAVPRDNVERQQAERTGVPVLLRADLLELLMAGQARVLVTGTHGKTTTSSMTTVALQAAGLDPSFAIGGAIDAGGTSAHHGTGAIFVAEADEAFRSFLRLTPDIAVVTNLEMDHHDEYADLDAYRRAYVDFLGRRTAGGLALLCADDPGSAGLAAHAAPPVRTYGTDPAADVRISDVAATTEGGSRFRLHDGEEDMGTITVAVPGLHNVRNAAAALIAARTAGADVSRAAAGLATFAGALRRFQRLGSAGGVSVVDDYGHHPTELAATVDAARQANPGGRVVAVFQPHRWSRTQALGAGLGRALAGADLVVVTGVYAAGEAPIPGVGPELVVDAARAAGATVHDATTAPDLLAVVTELVRPGDLVLTMGAGDITQLGPRLLVSLAEGSS